MIICTDEETIPISWDKIQAGLYDEIKKFTIAVINSRNGKMTQKNEAGVKARFDYEDYKDTGARVIAIGGMVLSRGLTLEGLMTSYYSRNAGTYDTLLQMCRWFGYRPKYEDLCRIYLTQESIDRFDAVLDAVEDMKEQFAEMKRKDKTPKEFGLMIRESPETLETTMLITARNKMRGTETITCYLNYGGVYADTSKLSRKVFDNKQNLKCVEEFVSKHTFSKIDGRCMVKDVSKFDIADLIRSLSIPYVNKKFDTEGLSEYIENSDIFTFWDVVIATGDSKNAKMKNCFGIENASAALRSFHSKGEDDLYIRIGGSNNRVLDPGIFDAGFDSTQKMQKRVKQETTGGDLSALDYLEIRTKPILVIYPIDLKTGLTTSEENRQPALSQIEAETKCALRNKIKTEVENNDVPLVAFAFGLTSKKDGEIMADRMSVTPSAVSINGKGRMIIGQRAYNSQNTDDLAIQFKRQMGTNKVIHFKSADIDKYPEDLSSEILKRLRSDAETRLNRNIKNVVITVPAAFKTLQSEATNKAGKIAGFENIILLQEPIAAAVAYGVKPEAKDKFWMVFDYGGGTLDVAIVSTVNNRLEVLNSEGDNYFGGSDLDRLIYNKIILPKLEKDYIVDDLLDEKTSSGKSMVRKILLDCENCKIELSNKESTLFELFDVDDDNGDPIEFECTITRGEFNALIIDTVNKSIEIAKSALTGANISADKIDKIILVGGSTFIPLVRQRLVDTFGKELESSINPMTVVAAGAAIYASTSVIDVDEEVTPSDFGSAILTLTYDPISSEQKVEVIGKVNNFSDINASKIRIDCAKSDDFSGVCWTSGWTDFLDKKSGIFDIDVLLQKNALNNFKVFLCDEYGKEIEVENALFQIKHTDNALKTSAPPATASIGIKIVDPNNNSYNKLNVVIKKNTPLPAKAEQTYKTAKDIDPFGDDSIRIEVFEGENIDNPEANAPAGIIYIQSSQMDRHIPKGTEIEITIEADENRNIIVSGYIPDIDYIIPQETLRPEAKIDLEERLDTVDRKIERTEASISKLKNMGVDTSSMESRLEEIKDGYDDAYDNLDNDESSVDSYIEEFYDLETEVMNQERSSDNLTSSENDYSSRIEENRKDIIEWGDEEAEEQFEELEEEFRNSYSEEEKLYVLDKMDKLKVVTLFNSFEFLRSMFTVVLARPEQEYTNRQKAEYWKTQAFEAIDNENVAQLRNAFIELMNLQPNSANSSFAGLNLADLTL